MATTGNGAQRMRGTMGPKKRDYCFITGIDGMDRFAHMSMFESDEAFLSAGLHQKVEFTHVDAEKGPRAIDVVVL
jgi:cold shock CspA family protein